jgi:hypothetical protein
VFPPDCRTGGEVSLLRNPNCYNQIAASIIVTAAPKLLLCDFRCSLFLSDTQNVSLAPVRAAPPVPPSLPIGVAARPQFQLLPLSSGLSTVEGGTQELDH